jgi:hypothetical protein
MAPAVPAVVGTCRIAVTFEVIAYRENGLNDGVVVGSLFRVIVVRRAREPYQLASFADADTCGPVITDVRPLLGRGVFRSAPFRNSSSSAC